MQTAPSPWSGNSPEGRNVRNIKLRRASLSPGRVLRKIKPSESARTAQAAPRSGTQPPAAIHAAHVITNRPPASCTAMTGADIRTPRHLRHQAANHRCRGSLPRARDVQPVGITIANSAHHPVNGGTLPPTAAPVRVAQIISAVHCLRL